MYNYAFEHQMVGCFINYSLRIHNLRIYAGINGNTFHRKHTGSERTLGNLYTNIGYKNDASLFTKLTYTFQKLTVFGDLQYRHTEFDYKGDVKFNKISWNFINPRIGLSYKITDHAEVYYSFGKTSREPTRNDIFRGEDNLLADSLGSPMIGVTKSEQVMNHELGYKLNSHSLHVNINCYFMKFANEIVLNGEYGPNGLPLHSNVAKSFRSGIEFDIDVPLTKNFGMSNNSNFSYNRIEEEHVTFQPVLTPNLMINQSVYFKLKSFYISLSGRYQKASYIDFANQYNIPEFYCLSSRISYTFGKITISLWLDNITNKKIYNQGYIGPNGNPIYFVQAPINYFTSIKWNF
jgi:iron complex outermembrane receptor protein